VSVPFDTCNSETGDSDLEGGVGLDRRGTFRRERRGRENEMTFL
jgi:hypothetical protein